MIHSSIVDPPTVASCATCGFELFTPIADLLVTTVALYSDHRFPGRCIVSMRPHYSDFLEMPENGVRMFMTDIRSVAQALQKVTKCDRVNYAILMNSVAHVHAHLIPRTYATDPVPNRAPWEHPEKAHPLEDERARLMCEFILEALKEP